LADEFVVLDNGETLVTGEWMPPPEDLAARLIALSNSLNNLMPLMLKAKTVAVESTKEHFKNQQDPQGVDWVPLTDKWLEDPRKAGSEYPTLILRMTGAGATAATSEEAYVITDNEIWFNPGAVPEYMIYHQFGKGGEHLQSALQAIRESRPFTQQEQQALASAGPGQSLPQREWLGLSSIDIAIFEDIANEWFEENINMVFPPVGGIVGEFGSNVLGTFPIVGYTKRGQPLLRTPQGIRFGRM
jgi:hypothetical protein